VGSVISQDDREPDGFDGWLRRIEAQEPTIVVYGWTRGYHVEKLRRWLRAHYRLQGFGLFKIWRRVEKPEPTRA